VNTDVRPVKVLGARRMKKTFFERRRNAICDEIETEMLLPDGESLAMARMVMSKKCLVSCRKRGCFSRLTRF